MENLTGGTPPVRYLPCVVSCKLYFDSLFYSFSNAFFLDKTLKGYDPIAVDGSDIYVDEMYGQYVKGAAEVTKAGLTSFIK